VIKSFFQNLTHTMIKFIFYLFLVLSIVIVVIKCDNNVDTTTTPITTFYVQSTPIVNYNPLDCGISLESPCNSILDAINIFYKHTSSKQTPFTVNLLPGVYFDKYDSYGVRDSFNLNGLNITIQAYQYPTNTGGLVKMIGEFRYHPFFTIDDDSVEYPTIIRVNGITFDKTFYYILTGGNSKYSFDIEFNNCTISNAYGFSIKDISLTLNQLYVFNKYEMEFILLENATLNIDKSSFIGNGNMNIIYGTKSNINIINTIFSNNNMIKSLIKCSESILSIKESIFKENTLGSSTLDLNASKLDFYNSTFQSNIHKKFGCIYSINDGKISIDKSYFTENTGLNGTCVYFHSFSNYSPRAYIKNTNFNLNIGTYTIYQNISGLEISNSLISFDSKDPKSSTIINIFYIFGAYTKIENTNLNIIDVNSSPYLTNFYAMNCQNESLIEYDSVYWMIPEPKSLFCTSCLIYSFNYKVSDSDYYFKCESRVIDYSESPSSSPSSTSSPTTPPTSYTSSYTSSYSTSYSTGYSYDYEYGAKSSSKKTGLSTVGVVLICVFSIILAIVLSFISYKIRQNQIRRKAQTYSSRSSNISTDIPLPRMRPIVQPTNNNNNINNNNISISNSNNNKVHSINDIDP